MKNRVSIILITAFVLVSIAAFGQIELCDTLCEFPDKEARFKDSGADVSQFFNDSLLELIYNPNLDDFPPTSFKMILVINEKDEVESIVEIKGDYSEETKNKILKKLKDQDGWKSAESNGQKVCSHYYFIITCILWN